MNISTLQIKWLKRLCVLLLAAGFAMLAGGCGKSTKEKLNDAIDASEQAAMLYNKQNFVKALSEIRNAIAVNMELKRDSALGENYLLLALCQRKLGVYDSSLDAFRASSEYFHLFGDQRLERRGRIALAELSYDLHRYPEALALASAAAAEGKVFSDSLNSFQAGILSAKIYHRLFNFAKEIETLNGLLDDPFVSRMGDARQDLWKMLFAATRATGDNDRIQELFDRWRTSYTGADSSAAASAFVAWGRYQESIGRSDQALHAYSQALNLLGGRQQRALQADVLTSLGNLSYSGKRFDNARLYYSDAMALAKQESNVILEQSVRLMIVACDWKLSGMRPSPQLSSEFEKKCQEVADMCAQTAFLKGQVCAAFLKGMIAERRSDSLAIVAYREALRLNITNVIPAEEDTTATDRLFGVILAGEDLEFYEPILRLLSLSNRYDEIFTYAEERNLRDIENFFSRLTESFSDPNLADAVKSVARQRSALQLLEAEILGELTGGRERNLERFETLRELLPQRLNELATTVGRIEGTTQRWLLYPKPLTLKMVRDSLPDNAVLVEYVLLQQRTLMLLVSRDTVLLRSSGVSRRQLLNAVREYSSLIGDARITTDAPMFNPAAAQRRINELSPVLYSWLLEPLAAGIGASTKIYIVPPVEFGYLPFHTLRPSGGPAFVARGDIAYLPSAAVILFPQPSNATVREIVGFGHPGGTGWDVEYEVRDIRGFFDKARMYFDTSATAAHLTATPCDLLHVAAPFTLNSAYPDSTGALVSDGVTPYGVAHVTLGDMMGMRLPKTIVFSNVSPVPGGLWRYPALAALASGSETVIFSMWQGDRKSKKYFGEAFYTHLMEGLPSSVAYSKALIAMTKNEETSRAYQWGLYYKFGK